MMRPFALLAVASALRVAPQPRTASTRLRAAPTAAAPPTATPTLAEMERWTREYYAAARDSRVRGGESMDAFLARYDYFDEGYVLTGPDVGPLCKNDYLATQRGFARRRAAGVLFRVI